MRLSINIRMRMFFASTGTLALLLFSACAVTPTSMPAANTPVANLPTKSVEGMPTEIVVYASDLQERDLFELDFYEDLASSGGKFISLPNNGDELDPPPENDPYVTFDVQVQSGVPYRCWVHMKVGAPKGRSQANLLWVQFTDAVDSAGKEVFKLGSGSYLTAEGPTQEGWTWVGCDSEDPDTDSLIYFGNSGQIKVRIQAGAEGVGFDQFLLSPKEFLDAPPSETIVEK